MKTLAHIAAAACLLPGCVSKLLTSATVGADGDVDILKIDGDAPPLADFLAGDVAPLPASETVDLALAAQSERKWDEQLQNPETVNSCKPQQPGLKVVLVTGTGGFIGFHTAQALKAKGYGVLGLDNFNSYTPVSLKRSRAAKLKEKGVVTIEADLNDADALKAAMDMCNFTHILALAAQAGVRYAVKDPGSYVKSNVAGFVTLLEVVRHRTLVPRVVYASSSSVYGLNTQVPFSEEHPVEKPASLYASTKRSNELLAHTYHHIYKIPLTGLRFFTVYGPYGRPDMALFSFANKISMGKPIRIFQGPGETELERDFTYIEDIVQGCVSAIEHIGEKTLRVYNLGNTKPHTVTDLVEYLEHSLGKKAIRNYVPLPALGDVLRTHANISLAREELGYEPKTSLQDGVRKFAEWYKEYYKDGLDQEMKLYEPL